MFGILKKVANLGMGGWMTKIGIWSWAASQILTKIPEPTCLMIGGILEPVSYAFGFGGVARKIEKNGKK